MADLMEKLTTELRSGLKPAYENFIVGGVYLAEKLNYFSTGNWKNFAGQNYFDLQGLFLSVLWSAPLLVNTLFSLCYLIVRWKKVELRHCARVARSKDD